MITLLYPHMMKPNNVPQSINVIHDRCCSVLKLFISSFFWSNSWNSSLWNSQTLTAISMRIKYVYCPHTLIIIATEAVIMILLLCTCPLLFLILFWLPLFIMNSSRHSSGSQIISSISISCGASSYKDSYCDKLVSNYLSS